MSVFTSMRITKNYKVRNAHYIRTENKPQGDDIKPIELVIQQQAKTK